MTSPINEEVAADLEWTPASRAEVVSAAVDPDLPRSILTPATATAPRGHIIDDSARGTIFWEAEHDDDEDSDETEQASPSSPTTHRPTSPIAADPSLTPQDQQQRPNAAMTTTTEQEDNPVLPYDPSPQQQTFGTPFRVEWLSTHRLPFYRTRGLRNPWNANREVKIARDGTELETSVGRKLVALFPRGNVAQAPPGISSGAPGPVSSGSGGANSPGQFAGMSGGVIGYGVQPRIPRPF